MTILWPTAYNTTRTLHDVVINSEASHWSPSAHVFHVIYKTHHITRIRNWSIPKGLTSSSGLLTAPCTVECPLSKSMAAFSETRSVHLAVWNVLIHREGCLSAYNHRNTFQHCIKIKNPPPSPFTLLPKPLIFSPLFNRNTKVNQLFVFKSLEVTQHGFEATSKSLSDPLDLFVDAYRPLAAWQNALHYIFTSLSPRKIASLLLVHHR